MPVNNSFDVVIIGRSYSGLAAGMVLGRALKKVLIIDDGKPCNRQTPFSHNFLTHDGSTPAEIAAMANLQVRRYETVKIFNGTAISGTKTEDGFDIQVSSSETFAAKKIIFATGIKDIMPGIDGFKACWGISVLHCPYCHGYEVRDKKTGVLCTGEFCFDLARLISNWSADLTLFTNRYTGLSAEQMQQFAKHHIGTIDNEVQKLEHTNGCLENIILGKGTKIPLTILYAPVRFEQHCKIPESLGCVFTEQGYIKTDAFQETTVEGVYACGDNATQARTVANAVATGTAAGINVSKKIIFEHF